MTWDGTERRKQREDGREGRRPSDQHCGEHYVLWTTHDKDKDEHRILTCGKIAKLETSMDKEVTELDGKIETLKKEIVGKYWFRFVVGILFASVIGLGIQQNWAFKEILTNQRDFAVSVNNIENKQIKIVEKISAFETEIIKLNNRQDVLRDIQIKAMGEHKGDDGRDGRDSRK